jgi:hypothetical protein
MYFILIQAAAQNTEYNFNIIEVQYKTVSRYNNLNKKGEIRQKKKRIINLT